MSRRNEREVSEGGDDAPSVSSANRGRPGPVHQALYNQILDDVRGMIMEYVPTMGEVVGKDGGRVVVHSDDEDEPRQGRCAPELQRGVALLLRGQSVRSDYPHPDPHPDVVRNAVHDTHAGLCWRGAGP